MDNSTGQQTDNAADEQLQQIKGIVESLLFVNERPVMLDQIKKVLEAVSGTEIKNAILNLQREYEERQSGMMIVEIAGGYQMLSNPAYAAYLRSFYKTKHKEKLSKPALESMAIVAYKQPVTRSDVELIRGVNSDGVIAHLLDKELLKVIGRKDVPGRPYLYGTTKQFLEYFGLKSLDDLPALEEFPTLQPAAEDHAVETAPQEEALPESETENVSQGLQGEAGGIQEDEQIVGETNREVVENEPEESAQKN